MNARATLGAGAGTGAMKTSASTEKFKIEIAERLELVQRDWDALMLDGRYTPFQTPHWLRPWYALVAPHIGARPLFVTVRDRVSGEPLMLLPLCLRRLGLLKIIEFADGGLSDYNAPILASNFSPRGTEMQELWRAILAALPFADVVRLQKLPALLDGRENPLHHLNEIRRMSLESWCVELPKTRAAYEKMLAPTFNKELRRKGRRVESHGKASLVHARDRADALRIFDALAEMRALRFEELGRDNVLAVPALRAFYETVIVEGWDHDFTALSALEVDGTIVAALFALRHAKNYHLLLSSFRSGDWKSASPGNVALDRMASHLIETGVEIFDFTIGNESYKRDFGAKPQALAMADHPLSLIGWPHAMRRVLSHHVGNSLRSPAVGRATSAARRILRIGS